MTGDAFGPGCRPLRGSSRLRRLAHPASIPIAKIIVASIEPTINEAEYWRRRATEGDVLRPLGKACHDCAVVWGLYSPMTDELAKQPTEIQEAVSVRWFCHNHPNRACRGNMDRLADAQAIEARRAETAPAGSVEDESAVAKPCAKKEP